MNTKNILFSGIFICLFACANASVHVFDLIRMHSMGYDFYMFRSLSVSLFVFLIGVNLVQASFWKEGYTALSVVGGIAQYFPIVWFFDVAENVRVGAIHWVVFLFVFFGTWYAGYLMKKIDRKP